MSSYSLYWLRNTLTTAPLLTANTRLPDLTYALKLTNMHNTPQLDTRTADLAYALIKQLVLLSEQRYYLLYSALLRLLLLAYM